MARMELLACIEHLPPIGQTNPMRRFRPVVGWLRQELVVGDVYSVASLPLLEPQLEMPVVRREFRGLAHGLDPVDQLVIVREASGAHGDELRQFFFGRQRLEVDAGLDILGRKFSRPRLVVAVRRAMNPRRRDLEVESFRVEPVFSLGIVPTQEEMLLGLHDV